MEQRNRWKIEATCKSAGGRRSVPQSVSGLRALLGEAVEGGIQLMEDTHDEFKELVEEHGLPLPLEDMLRLGAQVDEVMQRTLQQIRTTFPSHCADGSPAWPLLKVLVEETVMTGMKSWATALSRRVAAQGREQYFGGTLPADPQWLSMLLNEYLAVMLPGLEERGVPIPGTAHFLEERRNVTR